VQKSLNIYILSFIKLIAPSTIYIVANRLYSQVDITCELHDPMEKSIAKSKVKNKA